MADEPGYPSDGGRQAPDFLTVDQTADVLQLGRSTTYELVGRFVRSAGADGIPAILVGGQYRIPRARLEEYAGRSITWPPPPRLRKARPHRRSRKAADTATERAQSVEGGRHGHPEPPAPASERAAEAVIHIGAQQLPGTPADDLAPDRDAGCDAGSGDDRGGLAELTQPTSLDGTCEGPESNRDGDLGSQQSLPFEG